MPESLQISPGERLDVLERAPDVLVVEVAYAPAGSAPPAHYHPVQDEHFEILEGVLRVGLAGVERDLRAGETFAVPRGTPHRMWNPFAQPARARWETRPAGHTEAWFRALAGLQGTRHVEASGRPKALPFASLAHAYRDTFRLAAGPGPLGRIAVAALAHVARLTGRSPLPRESDLGALSGALAGGSFVTGLGTSLALADAPFPQPGAKPRAIRRFFQDNAGAARINVAGQLASAAWLALFARRVGALAEGSGRGPRALRAVTNASGGISSASLTASALTSLALTSRAGRRSRDAVVLHRRLFVAGGPVHTTAFGVFVGSLAVAGRQSRELPRGLTAAGLGSAVTGVLSPLSLVFEPAVLLVPAARVSGLLVCGIAGTRLSRSTARRAGEWE